MGHERVGALPKTARWRNIVLDLSSAAVSPMEATDIAARTLQNVRRRYHGTMYDEGVKAAFFFLVALSANANSKDPREGLSSVGIRVRGSPTPLRVTKAAHEFIEAHRQSPEYARIAKYATGDALAKWHRANRPNQSPLFDLPEVPYEVWRKAGSGSGFSELARLFFASFTERYLKYFLEREASEAVRDIGERRLFERNLDKAIDIISQHAFETSKVTQSFAAGWFNKHAAKEIPSEETVKNFLRLAFEKMAEELRRESEDA